MTQFDWYQGTLEACEPTQAIIKPLREVFDLSDWKQGRGLHGYQRTLNLVRGSTKFVTLAYGGNDGLHFISTGEHSPIVAPIIRDLKDSSFLCHQVTRVDSKMDFEEQGLFDKFARAMINYANNRKPQALKINMVGDWANGKGRTLYIGSRQSQVYVRLYEKGYETGEKLGLEVTRPDWIRFEVEYKPQSRENRFKAQILAPDDIFKVSYIPEMMEAMGLESGIQISIYDKKITDHERSKYYMFRNYGATMAEIVKNNGGAFEPLFDEIKEHLIKHHFR